MSWLPHAYSAARQSLTRHAVIVSTHPPVVTHMAAMALKLRTGRPWVADFRDPLWGNPSRTSERAAVIDPLTERMVVKLADAVIANTDSAAATLRGRYPAMAKKIHTIWNGFDPDDVIVPLPRPSRDRLVISHVGTLYGARTPLPFLLSLQRLIRCGADTLRSVQFRQIGRVDPGCFDRANPALEQLEGLGCLHRSSRHLRQADARQEMLTSDILLLLDMNDTNPGLQVPAKLYDYVRAGRPILALTPKGSATSRVLAHAGVPHACIDLNAPTEAIDTEVQEFLTMEHEPAAPSADFLREFSAVEQVKALAAILDAARLQATAADERNRVGA
jgi:hypothetical protein